VTIVAHERAQVTVGVDTHRDLNVAAVLDHRGVELATASFPTTANGHVQLLEWATGFGPIEQAGVEGTGSYGAGLTRYLQARGVTVIEVDRPNRQTRRRLGKTDTVDAIGAARAVQGGAATAAAKIRTGSIEAIRVLRVARTSCNRQRIQVINQLRALVTTAPDALRAELDGTTVHQLITRAGRLRPGVELAEPTAATKHALRSLARRVQQLDTELADLDSHLSELVAATAPDLVARRGVGTDTAGALLVACGDNPTRIHSEAALAHLCGAAPIEASSGPRIRHRLNRGGNREANQALWRIAMVRITCDPATRAYIQRRLADGKTKREAIRCLKRYIARELFRTLAQLRA
jgi:transposase